MDEQNWLEPLAEKSDELVGHAASPTGDAGAATKDTLINNRLLGHKRHPTITDVPFGSWTVTLVADAMELSGRRESTAAGDVALLVGLAASAMATAGGLADLSETYGKHDRKLGMIHGMLHGVTMLLYGGSWAARRVRNRALGRVLGFAGYGTLLAASYFANELAGRRKQLA